MYVVHAKDLHIIGLNLNDTILNSLQSKLGILSISILWVLLYILFFIVILEKDLCESKCIEFELY